MGEIIANYDVHAAAWVMIMKMMLCYSKRVKYVFKGVATRVYGMINFLSQR